MLPKNILVPTDLSEEATLALDYAVDLASRLGSTIHLLNVINGPALGVPELMSGNLVDSIIKDHQVMLADLADRYRTRALIGNVLLETGEASTVITDTVAKVQA